MVAPLFEESERRSYKVFRLFLYSFFAIGEMVKKTEKEAAFVGSCNIIDCIPNARHAEQQDARIRPPNCKGRNQPTYRTSKAPILNGRLRF